MNRQRKKAIVAFLIVTAGFAVNGRTVPNSQIIENTNKRPRKSLDLPEGVTIVGVPLAQVISAEELSRLCGKRKDIFATYTDEDGRTIKRKVVADALVLASSCSIPQSQTVICFALSDEERIELMIAKERGKLTIVAGPWWERLGADLFGLE
jgi:hypothetical protein